MEISWWNMASGSAEEVWRTRSKKELEMFGKEKTDVAQRQPVN